MTLELRSRASARKTGAAIWRRIYGDGFWGVCQGPKTGETELM